VITNPALHHGASGQHPWINIISASSITKEEHPKRLSFLPERYWHPACQFNRYRGISADDRRDDPQSFFAMILETDFVAKADQDRGKFRTNMMH